MKRKLLALIFISLANLSCATFNSGYYEALDDIKSGNTDFAFLKLKSYLNENPYSVYAPRIKFAIAEYYLQLKDYRDAIGQITEFLLEYPEEKNTAFAEALLYKALTEYKDAPQITEKIKKDFFSNPLFLIFSDSRIKRYKSILNNTYKIVDYVDRIEVFRNDEIILKVTP